MSELIKKDCGKHYGTTGGKCSKCALNADYQRKGYLQYQGTPWSAAVGPVVGSESIQDRAIESAHRWHSINDPC